MNRYPLWKYLLVLAILGLGLLYTLPNFFGDTLAVQISTNRQSLAINSLFWCFINSTLLDSSK